MEYSSIMYNSFTSNKIVGKSHLVKEEKKIKLVPFSQLGPGWRSEADIRGVSIITEVGIIGLKNYKKSNNRTLIRIFQYGGKELFYSSDTQIRFKTLFPNFPISSNLLRIEVSLYREDEVDPDLHIYVKGYNYTMSEAKEIAARVTYQIPFQKPDETYTNPVKVSRLVCKQDTLIIKDGRYTLYSPELNT